MSILLREDDERAPLGSDSSVLDDDGRVNAPVPSADSWGVQQDWTDADGRPQRVSDGTVTRVREAVGRPPPGLAGRAPIVTRPGRRVGVAGTVLCEDGTRRELDGAVPEDFPLGYHTLLPRDPPGSDNGVERRLVVSPGRCWVPDRQRAGW